MTEQNAQAEGPKLGAGSKLAVELGPLTVWFATYFFAPKFFAIPEGKELFYAIGAFMAAFSVAFVYSWYKERQISKILLISGVIVFITGGLTIFLQNRIFTYIKPTLVNGTFAAILAGGLLTGRLFLKLLFSQAFELTDDAWRRLTWRFVWFFIFLAILNEVVWRYVTYGMGCIPDPDIKCPGEPIWVNFKTFGVMPLTLLFTFAQVPFIMKNQPEEAQNRDSTDSGEATAQAENPHSALNTDEADPPSSDR